MSGLVICGLRFFFKQQYARARLTPGQFEAGGGANDAGADNDVIVVQLRLQTEDAFCIGEASTQPSWSMVMDLARDSAPLWQI